MMLYLKKLNFNERYVLFASIFSFSIWLTIGSIFPTNPNQHRFLAAGAFAIITMIASAMASGLTRKQNISDHGYMTAIWTSAFIGIIMVGVIILTSVISVLHNAEGLKQFINQLPMKLGIVLLYMLSIFSTTVPFCFIGTALFNGISKITGRLKSKLR